MSGRGGGLEPVAVEDGRGLADLGAAVSGRVGLGTADSRLADSRLADASGFDGAWTSQPGASAALVNRTRRVVLERARTIEVRRSRTRSLYIPLVVSAGLLAAVVFAIWSLLDGYDSTPNGLPDASQQIMVLLMWCLPVSAALLGVVWMRRAGGRFDAGGRFSAGSALEAGSRLDARAGGIDRGGLDGRGGRVGGVDARRPR